MYTLQGEFEFSEGTSAKCKSSKCIFDVEIEKMRDHGVMVSTNLPALAGAYSRSTSAARHHHHHGTSHHLRMAKEVRSQASCPRAAGTSACTFAVRSDRRGREVPPKKGLLKHRPAFGMTATKRISDALFPRGFEVASPRRSLESSRKPSSCIRRSMYPRRKKFFFPPQKVFF
jgi:hypothetical protein